MSKQRMRIADIRFTISGKFKEFQRKMAHESKIMDF